MNPVPPTWLRSRPIPGRSTSPVALVVLALALGLVLAACTGDSSDDEPPTAAAGFKPVINLAVNDWTASGLDAAIAERLIERNLGYPVELIREDDATVMYQAIAAGKLDAVLEVWPSTVAERDQRFFDRGQVVSLGPLGPVGQVGWYVPRPVLDAHPALATWEGLRDPALASQFATAESAPRGRLLGIDFSYHQFDEDIIRNLDLPWQVEYSGSEDKTLAFLDDAIAKGEPILLYWWVPTAVAASRDLVLVELPPTTDACVAEAAAGGAGVDCGYPPDVLFKAGSPALAAKAPDVAAFLGAFALTLDDQQSMLQSVEIEGKSVAAVADEWIEANEAVWEAWLVPAG